MNERKKQAINIYRALMKGKTKDERVKAEREFRCGVHTQDIYPFKK